MASTTLSRRYYYYRTNGINALHNAVGAMEQETANHREFVARPKKPVGTVVVLVSNTMADEMRTWEFGVALRSSALALAKLRRSFFAH